MSENMGPIFEAQAALEFGVCDKCGYALGPLGGMPWKVTEMRATWPDGSEFVTNPNEHDCRMSAYLAYDFANRTTDPLNRPPYVDAE